MNIAEYMYKSKYNNISFKCLEPLYLKYIYNFSGKNDLFICSNSIKKTLSTISVW